MRPRHSILAALLRWLGLSLCYLVLAGSVSTAEVAAAVLAGGFAAILSLGLQAKSERRLPLRGRWAGVVAQLAWRLARDTVRVGATLLRAVLRSRGHRGQVVLDREWVGRPVGTGAGRRAATALLASVTPDGIALETGDEAIPVHRLSRPTAPARRRRRSP